MLDDLILALRKAATTPLSTALAVATLALALGANSAVLSIADAVLFRPLPYAQPERLCFLRMLNRQTGRDSPLVPLEYLEALEGAHIFEGVARKSNFSLIVEPGVEGAEHVGIMSVAPDYFDVLGVRPRLGRLFDVQDADEPGRMVVLTYASWQQRFGADETVIGRSVTIHGERRDIIGVLPPGFVFPGAAIPPLALEFWPKYEYITTQPANTLFRPGAVEPVVRLARGVTRDQAQARIDAIASSVTPASGTADAVPMLVDLRSVLFPTGQSIMRLLLVASGFVLLLGCVNLAHLFLTRTRSRVQEIAVRALLGAGRARLMRPMLLEAVVVGIGAAVVALVVTRLIFDALTRQVPATAYGDAAIGVDWRVGLLTLALGVLSGVAFGAAPAWLLASSNVQASLARGGRHPARSHRAFGRATIALQAALATVLMAGAIVATRNLVSVLSVPLGFSPEDVVAIDARPSFRERAAVTAFRHGAVRALAERPDVAAAGATDALPLVKPVRSARDPVETPDGEAIGNVAVLPGYLETIGARLVGGRAFSWDDTAPGSRAVILNESASRTLFQGVDPVGRTVRTKGGHDLEVIGVVADVRMSLTGQVPPLTYMILGDDFGGATFVARMRVHSDTAPIEMRRFVNAMASDMPVTTAWWTDAIDSLAEYRTPRFQTVVLGTFAALAMLLTVLGVFGVVSSLVANRTHEIGVRLALGATRSSIVGAVLRYAAAPVLIGVAVGFGAGWALGRLAEAHLAGFEAGGPGVFVAGAAIAVATALLSAYVPARRAGRLDPTVLLRVE